MEPRFPRNTQHTPGGLRLQVHAQVVFVASLRQPRHEKLPAREGSDKLKVRVGFRILTVLPGLARCHRAEWR